LVHRTISALVSAGSPRCAVRMIEQIEGATVDAIDFATARGWVQVEGGHRITLTKADQQLAKDLGSI
jgi:hypothetical protein